MIFSIPSVDFRFSVKIGLVLSIFSWMSFSSKHLLPLHCTFFLLSAPSSWFLPGFVDFILQAPSPATLLIISTCLLVQCTHLQLISFAIAAVVLLNVHLLKRRSGGAIAFFSQSEQNHAGLNPGIRIINQNNEMQRMSPL